MKINTLVKVNGYGDSVFKVLYMVEGDISVQDVICGDEMLVCPTTVVKLSRKAATKYVGKYMRSRMLAGVKLTWEGKKVVDVYTTLTGDFVVICTDTTTLSVHYRKVVANLRLVVESTREVF
jgi:hypothetical protein